MFSFFPLCCQSKTEVCRSGYSGIQWEPDLHFSSIFRDHIGHIGAIWFGCAFDSSMTARNSHPGQQTSNLKILSCLTFFLALVRSYVLKLRQRHKSLLHKYTCLLWNQNQSDLLTQSKFLKDNTSTHRKSSSYCRLLCPLQEPNIKLLHKAKPESLTFFFFLQLFTCLDLHSIIRILKGPKIFVLNIFRCLKAIFNLFLKEIKLMALSISRNKHVFRCSVRLKDDNLKYTPHNCFYSTDCNTSLKLLLLSLQ